MAQVGPQRPGGVAVADAEGEVRDAGEHRALPDELLAGRPALVDRRVDATERQQLQPGGGDDDVGLEELPVPRRIPSGTNQSIWSGDDLGLAALMEAEQVAVGTSAQALVPGVVRRGEVLGHHRGVAEDLLVIPSSSPRARSGSAGRS